MDNLRKLDLNLLLTLNALLVERNVTRAAARLHLSQPSVSVQLGKLRDAFDDPLLLPGPRGMLPTARALELLAPLQAVLAQLEQVLLPVAPFEPAQAQVEWKLAAADAAEYAILLPMLPALRVLAPLSRMAVHEAVPARMAQQLENGQIDLGFVAQEEAPAGLRHRLLFREHYVLAGRHDHPLLQSPPSLEQFCALEFIVVSTNGGGYRTAVDATLEQLGRQRKVVLSVPHFLIVPHLLAASDMVAMLPSRLLKNALGGLRTWEPPVTMPDYDMAMVWHERMHLDPAHRWLREQIAARL
ncbi:MULTISPECIES: LysR family transcriptional regulator [unclassified Janthinobacterium]|uniref:LysR family transcriptional regulator n=1 Tax=unclassified Janthinobacterium TaxID=2610881 RepID=UPI00161DDD3C|nr:MULTISPECIES: LysR family transcriptional regulator [unclassified Janthinobacterium]MBB5371341.1 DNA-binding transcriptional LysR family regulator [Janthinobacterium sp. K2C7]MBB5384147.1 DNA-binding transcriptional LysR family regulator [Janthinobacterium sp. K2Li3]MBB5389393.1 DNA-binding transcriptional LysR family regulator [Janthinobacterium sp. K2E3]